MKPYLIVLLFVLILSMCLMADAAPYACGPNGCGPAYGSVRTAGLARGGIFRGRRPVRRILSLPFRLVGRAMGRGC